MTLSRNYRHTIDEIYHLSPRALASSTPTYSSAISLTWIFTRSMPWKKIQPIGVTNTHDFCQRRHSVATIVCHLFASNEGAQQPSDTSLWRLRQSRMSGAYLDAFCPSHGRVYVSGFGRHSAACRSQIAFDCSRAARSIFMLSFVLALLPLLQRPLLLPHPMPCARSVSRNLSIGPSSHELIPQLFYQSASA